MIIESGGGGLAPQRDSVQEARLRDTRCGAVSHDRVQLHRRHAGVEDAGQTHGDFAIGAADVHDLRARPQPGARDGGLQPLHRQGVADGQGFIGDVMKGDAHGQGLGRPARPVSEKELYIIKFLVHLLNNRQGETP